MPSQSFKYGPSPIAALTPLIVGSAQFSTAVNVLPKSQYQGFTWLVNFTKGSLTNVTLTPQVTYDGTTWFDLLAYATAALTADTIVAIPCPAPGAKQVRLKYVATGTATSSALTADLVTQLA